MCSKIAFFFTPQTHLPPYYTCNSYLLRVLLSFHLPQARYLPWLLPLNPFTILFLSVVNGAACKVQQVQYSNLTPFNRASTSTPKLTS